MISLFGFGQSTQRISGKSVRQLPAGAPDVLVVDDSPGVCNVLSTVISRAGLTHVVATSLADVEALQLSGAQSLVLLDLALDRSDALDVLQHLKDIGFAGSVAPMSGQDPAILAYVATAGTSLGLRMLPPLKKPFRLDAVRQLLGTHCSKRPQVDPSRLAEAIQKGKPEFVYQPRLHLTGRVIEGFETVVLVKRSDGTSEVFDFAQQLPDELGTQLAVLSYRQAVNSWERFARAGMVLKPCLKIRARDLAHPLFAEAVREQRPADIRWSGLRLKLLEPELIDSRQEVRAAVVKLQLHKIQYAYAEFEAHAGGRVRSPEFKVSEVVVEERYVSRCSSDPERRRICKAAVLLGRESGLCVVAEGVKTAEDALALADLGFDGAQGPIFSAPLPLAGFEEMLRSQGRWVENDPGPGAPSFTTGTCSGPGAIGAGLLTRSG